MMKMILGKKKNGELLRKEGKITSHNIWYKK